MLDPLTVEPMAEAMRRGPLVIALSGGGDSTALLHLLAERFGPAPLHALIVDHALRPGAAADARRAQRFASELGVAAQVLTLAWPAGPKRAQRAAREARYRALCDAARGLGACMIAVAHTLDDQVETVLMRARAGSSWRGLAGMAALASAPVWPQGRELELVRPLLGVRRKALRAWLEARRAAWIEDPANTNEAFERVRVRARLAALESAGLKPERLARLAAALRAHADALDAQARALIATAARFEADRIVLSRAAWAQGGEEARRRALAALLAAASGRERAPESAALSRLLQRMGEAGFRGASLGGARIAAKSDHFLILRDPGALSGRAGGVRALQPLALNPGEIAVWDGRLEIEARAPGWRVEAEAGAPVFVRARERRALAEAGAAAQTHWLLAAHANHVLR